MGSNLLEEEEKHLTPVRTVCRAGTRNNLVVNILVVVVVGACKAEETRLKKEARRFKALNFEPLQRHSTSDFNKLCGMIRPATSRVASILKSCSVRRPYSSKSAEDSKIEECLSGWQPDLTSAVTDGVSEPSSKSEDGVTTYHPPVKRRHLPTSPFLDADFYNVKRRQHIKKPLPSKERTEFQKQLDKNPYALALATPIRKCRMTEVHLPKFFLQDFKMIAHPDTGKSWFMPRSLTNKRSGEDHTPGVGPTQYTISSRRLLLAMQTADSGYIKMWAGAGKEFAHTVPFQEQNYMRYRKAVKSAATSFRPDMHDFVLELMRRRTLEELIQLVELRKGYLVGCTGWEDALVKPQVAAFLWMGEEGPTEFATMDVGSDEIGQGVKKKRKVPVHNLGALLGEEKLAELRGRFDRIFERELVMLRHKRMTVELEMKLWKLEGYLAEYKSFMGAKEKQKMDEVLGAEKRRIDESMIIPEL